MIAIWRDGDRTWLYDDYYRVVWLAGTLPAKPAIRGEKFISPHANGDTVKL